MQRALVEQARNGELEAFTQLVKVSLRRLTGVANLILRDSELAQDAVQELRRVGVNQFLLFVWIERLTIQQLFKHLAPLER